MAWILGRYYYFLLQELLLFISFQNVHNSSSATEVMVDEFHNSREHRIRPSVPSPSLWPYHQDLLSTARLGHFARKRPDGDRRPGNQLVRWSEAEDCHRPGALFESHCSYSGEPQICKISWTLQVNLTLWFFLSPNSELEKLR